MIDETYFLLSSIAVSVAALLFLGLSCLFLSWFRRLRSLRPREEEEEQKVQAKSFRNALIDRTDCVARLTRRKGNMEDKKYNMKNPAVKRILQEVKEMQNNPSDDYMSLPLEDNIFEWQFAIRGPSDTEFEGGIYHGRIQLPPEYPFKPPAFMLLTPNGRFETQTKICLSISQHHPEHWQPSWSVRTALVALIAFMPTKPDGALGSLDYTKEERRTLAINSRDAAPKFGTPERQALIDEIHEHLMKKVPPVPELAATNGEAEAIDEAKEKEREEQTEESPIEEEPQRNAVVENVQELHVDANAGPIAVNFSAGFLMATQAPPAVAATPAGQQQPQLIQQVAEPEVVAPGRSTIHQTYSDFGLTFLAGALTVAIFALFIKKLMNLIGAMLEVIQ